jgi:hypothetical protein
MTTTKTTTSRNPLEALGSLLQATTKETSRAFGELAQHKVDDINSIAKAVETGGLSGGALQFFDVGSFGHNVAHVADALTGPGALDPRVKEGISAGVNAASLNPMALKDLLDLATLSGPSKTSSAPAQSVPAPDVQQLTGGAPQAPRHDGGTGWAESPAPARHTIEVRIRVVENTAGVSEWMQALRDARNSEVVKAHAPAVHAVLHDDNATLGEISVVITAEALRHAPETLNDPALDPVVAEARARFAAENAAAPSTSTGDFSQAGQQAMGVLGQLAGPLGMGMQLFGSLLSNPVVANFLAPLLAQALNLVAPGLGVALAPILPMALPLAGQMLSAGGGMLAGGGVGGMTPDALGSALGSLGGAFAPPAAA